MAGLDPDSDSGDATIAPSGQGQVQDYSKPGGLRQAWSDWSSRPENTSAMINFGLNLLQPIPPGQSQMGHFAEALGAGLAGGGEVSKQEEERGKYEEAQTLKEREEARKERETSAYETYVQGKGLRKLSPIELEVIAQRNFNKWAQAAPPIVGDDQYVSLMNKRHPEAKGRITKQDLIDPRSPYGREVKEMMRPQGDQYTGGILGGGTSMDIGAGGGAEAPEGFTVKSPDGTVLVKRGGRWQAQTT